MRAATMLPAGETETAILSGLAYWLDAGFGLKRAGDALGDWPIGALIGISRDFDRARSFPFIGEMRRSTTPYGDGLWEFVIPDSAVSAVYERFLRDRGIPHPGPIAVAAIPDRVRDAVGPGMVVCPLAWADRNGQPLN